MAIFLLGDGHFIKPFLFASKNCGVLTVLRTVKCHGDVHKEYTQDAYSTKCKF